MMLNLTRRLPSFWLVSLMGFFLAGCSLVSIDEKTRYRDAEGYFEPTLLTQIKAGETSKTWLIQHFGRPWFSEVDGLTGYPDEVGIHTWRFEREQQKSTRVLLLLRSRKTSQHYEYLHVVTEGESVKRAWQDDLSTVDIRRLMAAIGYRKTKARVQASQQPMAEPSLPTIKTETVPPPASLVVEDTPAPETQEKTPPEAPE
jgi:hypothetical protein